MDRFGVARFAKLVALGPVLPNVLTLEPIADPCKWQDKKQGQALRLVSLRNAIIALVALEVGCHGFMSLIESDFEMFESVRG